MKILILYFSGAGSSKKVAGLIRNNLSNSCETALLAVEEAGGVDLAAWDGLVVGTPVYHAAPARLLTAYFGSLPPLLKPLRAFLFNTRATWSCNTNRILAKGLQDKNIHTVLDRDYRAPASDGSLIAPFVGRFFRFEKGLEARVARDCALFLGRLAESRQGYLPRFRFSGVLNGPNKLAGQHITFPIHLHRERCTRCGRCARNCPHNAVRPGTEGYPAVAVQNCENCYRCIHHCPGKALSLSRHRAPDKLLEF